MNEKTDLTLGIVPLTDCAPIVIAKEKGYFEEEGLFVTRVVLLDVPRYP